MFDIGFTGNPDHGWIVGGNATLLETTDGGNTWQPKSIDIEEEKARLTSVSFNGNEGWILGQPSLLLHTDDQGESWTQIPLSSKLPGAPNTIIALGPDSAEMTTDVGAIYRTEDSGQHWRAQVEDAVGVVRNISRSPDGKYIAVSAKGNFTLVGNQAKELGLLIIVKTLAVWKIWGSVMMVVYGYWHEEANCGLAIQKILKSGVKLLVQNMPQVGVY